ncbi:uncharacterized protein LOC119838531 [Zerene cesonia]|uniref:uncharacterized protein LOC119838531 n=1 Tax=Zerene cesonia TaxID=33412 RepID=UPI0018E58541|nr:uncharacterized protein LOC119838531 [Zerene cesonia]
MSGFKALRDISKQFENELKLHSSNLFCAKVDESFENVVAKKIRDISLITSKLRLLQAKTISATPQIKETSKDEITTINDYTETITWKLIEQQIVKTLMQTHSVKTLVTAPDRSLDPELLERKEKLIAQVTEYSQKERTLLHLDGILKEREMQLLEAREEWDRVFGDLKDNQNVPRSEERATGPLHKKTPNVSRQNGTDALGYFKTGDVTNQRLRLGCGSTQAAESTSSYEAVSHRTFLH